MPADRATNKILGARDRDFEFVTERETGGDRRGIGASRAVSRYTIDKRR